MCVVRVIKHVQTGGTWIYGNHEKRTENFGRMTPVVITYETSAYREGNMKMCKFDVLLTVYHYVSQ
jgi:hypothetical protein